MLKISIECTRFESNYSSCTGRSSENICSSSEGGQEKGKRGWNSVYHQNWWKKLVWFPVISFRKISFPVTHLIPYCDETHRSRPLTLRITWIFHRNKKIKTLWKVCEREILSGCIPVPLQTLVISYVLTIHTHPTLTKYFTYLPTYIHNNQLTYLFMVLTHLHSLYIYIYIYIYEILNHLHT